MGDNFDHAFASAIGNCAVIAAKRGFKTNHPIVAKARLGIIKPKPDMRKLRIAISDPWYRAIIQLGRYFEQNIANDNASMIARNMGILLASGNITNGIDMPVACSQPPISDNALGIIAYLCGGKLQPVKRRFPANRN